MNTPLNDVCCASLPLAALPALAAVRCVPDVTVAIVGQRAWLHWPPGHAEVLHCVTAIAGVELFKPHKGAWYRPGQHLPAFGLPFDAASQPLLQMLVPTPVHPELAPEPTLQPVTIRLVREEQPRMATALWCNLSALRKWADRAPTAELAAVHAARCDEQVLLLGRRLPPLPGAERLWGERLLIPLGYRPEPALPESILLEALQVSAGELVVCRTALLSRPDGSGEPSYGPHFDIVPRTALQPLTRAAVRLALGGSSLMDALSRYLLIPADYSPFLGRLRWSANGEAIEYDDGTTFVFAPQLALFVEGLSSVRRPLHFAFVLHLLYLLGYGKEEGDFRPRALTRAFEETGRPLRNAGTLCGLLCRILPGVTESFDVVQLCRHLASPALMAQTRIHMAIFDGTGLDYFPAPPLESLALEKHFLDALSRLTVKELRQWLRHGCIPPSDAGEEVARAVPTGKPRTLRGVLGHLVQQRRLAGAVPFVAQMVSALALPPRRLAHHELPLGGYADVATRGHPEQILPSQFAVEEMEFVRRFAENELLYFRREEPHARVNEELVLLLDQGVRTWGEVRLVLGGAVLAFGKRAAKRGLPLLLAATSNQGHLLDPLQAVDKQVADLLEASDLSANPGLALECVLLQRPASPVALRDVVLLTHPRSLGDADVSAAARRVPRDTRLFAVTVDGHGTVQLCALRHGTPVKLSQFQVDFNAASAVPAEDDEPLRPAEPLAPWRGDVEPVPFPFRFGVVQGQSPHLFEFDLSGEWLVEVGQRGVLHAWQPDGPAIEVLPRGLVDGTTLSQVDALLGVAGGVVACGVVRGKPVAVHYDFTLRKVTAHALGSSQHLSWAWRYFPEFHTVVVRCGQQVHAVDLDDGSRASTPPSPEAARRASRAWVRAWEQGISGDPIIDPRSVLLLPTNKQDPPQPYLRFYEKKGEVFLGGVTPPWIPFVPLADGKPMQLGRMLTGQYAGSVLALLSGYERTSPLKLRLFRGPNGVPLGEINQARNHARFALSADGRRLARQTGPCQVEVRCIGDGLSHLAVTPRGRCHQDVQVELGDMWLTMQVGKMTHLVRWDGPALDVQVTLTDKATFVRQELAHTKLRPAGVRLTRQGLPKSVWYDMRRFSAGAFNILDVVVDCFGQVAVFGITGELICMFFVFRDQFAAWLPDGTRCGPASLIGGPGNSSSNVTITYACSALDSSASPPPAPSPAALKIGRVLREAWQYGLEGKP